MRKSPATTVRQRAKTGGSGTDAFAAPTVRPCHPSRRGTVQEGGYNLLNIRRGAAAFFTGLADGIASR